MPTCPSCNTSQGFYAAAFKSALIVENLPDKKSEPSPPKS